MAAFFIRRVPTPEFVEEALGLSPGDVSWEHQGPTMERPYPHLKVDVQVSLSATQKNALARLLSTYGYLDEGALTPSDFTPITSVRDGISQRRVVNIKMSDTSGTLAVTWLDDDLTERVQEFVPQE